MNRVVKKTHHEIIKRHRKVKPVKPKPVNLISRRHSYPGHTPVTIYAYSSGICDKYKLEVFKENKSREKERTESDGFQLFTPRRMKYSISSIRSRRKENNDSREKERNSEKEYRT